MRRLIVAAVLASVSVAAEAADLADLPILRGPVSEGLSSSSVNWQGIYIGGHYGYSSQDFDFSKTAQGLQRALVRNSDLATVIPDWELLGTSNVRWQGFGGFAGYNWQFTDVIGGIEINYTRFTSKPTASTGSLTRLGVNPPDAAPPPGHTYTYDLTLTGNGEAKVNDLLNLRARGGWDAGIFMPYAFAGLAIASVDVKRSASITGLRHDNYFEGSTSRDDVTSCCMASKAENQKNLLTFGFSAGLGTEILLTQNIFLRAEYEYVQLPVAKDTLMQLHTIRGGIGAKF